MLFVQYGHDAYGSKLAAKRSFAPGDLIYQFSGYRVTTQPTYQTIQIGADKHIDHLDVLAYLNHSCSPNTLIDTENLSVIAARAINAGEELTFFYPSTEWEMAQPFVCCCKVPGCLGLVAGAKFLSLEVLQRYYISQHIWELYNITMKKTNASKACFEVHVRDSIICEKILS
jgi:hypothetical protein